MAVGLLAAVTLVIVIAALAGGGSSPQSSLDVDASLSGDTARQVGGTEHLTLTVTNHDTDIQNLTLFMADGKASWLDHHVVISSGPCRVASHGRMSCGPLARGASTTIEIVANARDAGDFSYEFGIGDTPANGSLRQWDEGLMFSEAVSPATSG
jgi:hypothetical protein